MEAKKRGGARPGAGRKHVPLESRIRVGIWYCEVRWRSGLNDCQLDCLIAVEPGEPPCETAARPRIFERIRTNQRNPNHRRLCDANGRHFNVADRVEHHWPGTKQVLVHPLWSLIGKQRPDLTFVQRTIAAQLALAGLRRMGHFASWALRHIEKASPPPNSADWKPNVVHAAAQGGNLDGLALLAAMILEAEMHQGLHTMREGVLAFNRGAKQFVADESLSFIPELSGWFSGLTDEFIRRLGPYAGNPVPEFNHLCYIVRDDRNSQELETMLDSSARIQFGRWLEGALDAIENKTR